jgi:hypothetical protein
MNKYLNNDLKLFLYLIIVIGLTSLIFKSDDEYWLRSCTIEYDSCGYKNQKGKWEVSMGRYTKLYTDTFRTTAIVYEKNQGIIGINKKGERLYFVHVFDNGPDPIFEGLFRIIIDNKYGFANMNNIVIDPKFDFVYPFSEGLAIFNKGCTLKKEMNGDHVIVDGGKLGYINKEGVIIINAQYDYAESFTNNCARVVLNEQKILIDKNGKIIGHW